VPTVILAFVPLAGLAIVLLLTFVGCGLDADPIDGGSIDGGPIFDYNTNVEAVPSIVSHWPLWEASSDQPALDRVGGNNGVYKTHSDPGDPALESAPTSGTIEFLQSSLLPNLSEDASIRVDGGYVEVPFAAALNTATFSFIAWVQTDWTDTGFYRCVLASRTSTASEKRGYMLYANPDNKWEAWIGDGTNWQQATSSNPIAFGRAQLLCVTYDGTALKLYVDSEQEASATGGYQPSIDNPLRIGDGAPEQPNPLFPFIGRMAHVAYFNDALDAQTVASIYMAGAV
jgi:hypothetical protein